MSAGFVPWISLLALCLSHITSYELGHNICYWVLSFFIFHVPGPPVLTLSSFFFIVDAVPMAFEGTNIDISPLEK